MKSSGDKPIDKSIRLSLIDAFLYSLMVGAGESYLPAYAISLGLGEVAAGILTSLPLVSGAFLQLFTPKWVQKIGKPKSWIVVTAIVQSLAFLPLIYFSSTYKPDFWILFIVFTLYWASGFSINPFWTYWMSHLIPDSHKNEYFSLRSKISQVGIMIGLIGGGLALSNKVEFGPFSSVFSILFFLAFTCRLLSGIVLSQKVYFPEWNKVMNAEKFSFVDSLKFLHKKSETRNLLFLLFPFYASVFISAPFVNPFLIAQLKMDYSHYMGSLVALLLGKYLCSWALEKFSHKITSYSVFFWGVFCISPGPMFWGISNHFAFIFFLQFFSGIAWACYEVGTQLILFKDISLKEKIPFVSLYNFFMSAAAIVGTFIGAFFLRSFSATYTTYITLFLLGGLARVVLSAPLLRLIKNLEEKKSLKDMENQNFSSGVNSQITESINKSAV